MYKKKMYKKKDLQEKRWKCIICIAYIKYENKNIWKYTKKNTHTHEDATCGLIVTYNS